MKVGVKAGSCWWCGAKASSREHKIKRSDLVRDFGKQFDEPLVRLSKGLESSVQGPGSTLLKFEANLCSNCNSARSQPFDRAYDSFTGYLAANQKHVLASRRIDLRSVYGNDWREATENLLRYLVKHAGCRLTQNDVRIPSSLVAYLDGSALPSDAFALEVEIRGDVAEMVPMGFTGGLGFGDLLVSSFDAARQPTVIESHLDYRWFRFAWAVGEGLGGYGLPFTNAIEHLPVRRVLPPGELQSR